MLLHSVCVCNCDAFLNEQDYTFWLCFFVPFSTIAIQWETTLCQLKPSHILPPGNTYYFSLLKNIVNKNWCIIPACLACSSSHECQAEVAGSSQCSECFLSTGSSVSLICRIKLLTPKVLTSPQRQWRGNCSLIFQISVAGGVNHTQNSKCCPHNGEAELSLLHTDEKS